jgi:hypothetical protein
MQFTLPIKACQSAMYYVTLVDTRSYNKYIVRMPDYSYPHNDRGAWPHTPTFSSLVSKKDIDTIPRHLRRGGKYGHDSVRLLPGDHVNKNLCRRYNLTYTIRNHRRHSAHHVVERERAAGAAGLDLFFNWDAEQAMNGFDYSDP